MSAPLSHSLIMSGKASGGSCRSAKALVDQLYAEVQDNDPFVIEGVGAVTPPARILTLVALIGTRNVTSESGRVLV